MQQKLYILDKAKKNRNIPEHTGACVADVTRSVLVSDRAQPRQ